jgi:hypothetical protein
MNDPTLNPNAAPSGEVPLTAEQQALHEQFLCLPTQQRLRLLCLMLHWEQAPPKRRALALKLLNAALSGKDVAWLSGVSDRQLRRYPEFRTAARLLHEPETRLPRGTKGRDGELEAWDGEE